jgi:hypothetical protein
VDVDGSSSVKSISGLCGVCLMKRWNELKVTVEVVRGCSRGEEWGDSYRDRLTELQPRFGKLPALAFSSSATNNMQAL